MPEHIARRLTRSSAPGDITQPLAAHRARHSAETALLMQVASRCGTALLDPAPLLCRTGTCPGTEARQSFYYDAYHLNDRGAMRLVPMFRSWLGRVPDRRG